MLVSHSHKFIFIKSKKTAGSSIQDYLAPYCRKGIVEKYIPGGHRTAESTKRKIGDEIWNSYLKICPVRNPWDILVSWYFWRKRPRSIFVKVKRILKGKDPQNEAYRMTFRDFIIFMRDEREVNINRKIIEVNGDWPDYFFIRYEHLHEDMTALCGKLGIPYNPDKLPMLKVGVRKDKSYRDFYDDETREAVAQAFKKDIERFGYQF